MSVSGRRPPPSPYASMSLQSSADGSGPLDSAAGGSGPLSAQAFLPSAQQQQQQQATVLEEGRSGSLETRDRAVSFENWKVNINPLLCLWWSLQDVFQSRTFTVHPDGSVVPLLAG